MHLDKKLSVLNSCDNLYYKNWGPTSIYQGLGPVIFDLLDGVSMQPQNEYWISTLFAPKNADWIWCLLVADVAH